MSPRAALSIFTAASLTVAVGCSTPAHTALLRVNPVAPGAQCPAGGAEVRSGIDSNNDGTLENDEVLDTSYLCNGVAGSGGGSATVVRVVPEPPGSHCSNGGSAVEAGLDLNGNGALDDGEVMTTSYVCDGKSGVLVRVEVEPAGVHCLRGGTAIESGFDSNQDGTLQDGEVTSTSYVCNPVPTVIVGDVTIAAASDVAQLTGVPRIEGSLIVQAADLTQLYLPDLVEIAGDFQITDAAATLTTVRLPRLVTVSGAVDLGDFGSVVQEPTLPALTSAARIDVTSNRLTSLSLEALTTVAGKLTIDETALPTFPPLVALTHVGGLEISYNSIFNSLTLPANLRAVDGDVTVGGNPKVTGVSAGYLAVGGSFSLASNTALTWFRLSTVTLGGTFTVSDDPAVAGDDDYLFGTPHVLHGLVISNNDGLTALPIDIGVDTLDVLKISDNPLLTQIIDFSDLRSINFLDVEDNASLLGLGLTRLDYCESTLISGNANSRPACRRRSTPR